MHLRLLRPHSLFIVLGLAGTRTYSVRRPYSVLVLERTALHSYQSQPMQQKESIGALCAVLITKLFRNFNDMGNYRSHNTEPVWPPASSQNFFPDSATRESDDAAFYEAMRFIQQECLDNSDDESEKADKTTATAPKKEESQKTACARAH
jgi:hypothetical protein